MEANPPQIISFVPLVRSSYLRPHAVEVAAAEMASFFLLAYSNRSSGTRKEGGGGRKGEKSIEPK